MKKIVLLAIMSIVLLTGCALPEIPSLPSPVEVPLPQWEVQSFIQETVNEESWQSGDDIVIGGWRFTDVTVPQGSRVISARIEVRELR